MVDQLTTPPGVLRLVNASVQLDAIEFYDPKAFTTRKGLEVCNKFHRRIGSKAKLVEGLGTITLTSAELCRSVSDKEISADPIMPANHMFVSESEFVAYLDQMISKQPNGEEGNLRNDSYWNIFYVAGCVARVARLPASRIWLVRAGELECPPPDGVSWYEGFRVFGCNGI